LDERTALWATTAGCVSPSGDSFVGNTAEITHGRLLTVQRYILDHKLAQAALREGAEVIDGSPVTDFSFSKKDGMWTIFCRQDEALFSHAARVLVAADGAKSKIARKLGVVTTSPDSTGSCIASKVQSGQHPLKADAVFFYPRKLLEISGYFLMAKHVGDVFQLCCYIRGNFPEEELLKIHMDLITTDPSISKSVGANVRLNPIQCAPMRTGGVPRSVADHFICIGDAAGQIDPLTGEGIQYAMESAKIAAVTLSEGFANDDLSENFLSLYHKRRKWSFSGSNQFSAILFGMPLVVDAACGAIRRHGTDYLRLWCLTMTAKRSKLWFLKPHFLIAFALEFFLPLHVAVVQ